MTEAEYTQLRRLIDRARGMVDRYENGEDVGGEGDLIRDLAAYDPAPLTKEPVRPPRGPVRPSEGKAPSPAAADAATWEQLLERQRQQVRNDATDALELIRSSTVFERRGRVCGLAYDSWYLTVLPDAEWLAIWLDVASGQQYVCSVLRSQFGTFLPKGETP